MDFLAFMVVKKYNWIESTQKIHASRGGCEMHANQFLVGMASPVLEILLHLKFGQIPFRTMDYSPWGSKNLIK